ncbi:MAG: divalent-cation tolerance protein CutA [Pseudomonadota bacterium]
MINVDKAALIWCPCPDPDIARELAETLLSEKLTACANIIPQITSVFEWNGKANTEAEAVLVLKTRGGLLDQATLRLGECHPYDTPAIVGWVCDTAHPATLGWLGGVLDDS